MTTATGRPARASATHTYAQLHIDSRVLTTPSRTIAVSAIATIGVGTHVEHRPRLLLWIGAICLGALAFGATQVGVVAQGQVNFVAIMFALLAAGVAVFALKPDDKTHYLLISTVDGAMTRFASDDRALLDEVRRLLTEKLNSNADGTQFNVNFETGVIDNLSVNRPEPQTSSSLANGAGGPNLNGSRPPPTPGPSQTSRPAAGPPQQRMTSSLNGPLAPPPESYVDFAVVLPAIVDMQRFYARQPNAQHVEQRLSELELLMRAGAQTSGQKARVRELAREMSHILQAYQPAVQMFHQISAMAA